MTVGPPRGRQVIVLLGGPGSGKGTQASRLSPILGVPHVSSGELLRSQTSGGDRRMLQGELVPDEVATQIVLDRLEQPDAARGAILDGFPRDVQQAQALDAWLERHGGAVRAVLYLELPRGAMIDRVVERGKDSQRGDDRADVADRRAEIFAAELPPLLEHYARRGLVTRIDAAQPIDAVQRQILEALERPARPAC
jgi:adenylate kinase